MKNSRGVLFFFSEKSSYFLVVPDVVLAVTSSSTSSSMDAGLAPEGGAPNATMATNGAGVWKDLNALFSFVHYINQIIFVRITKMI